MQEISAFFGVCLMFYIWQWDKKYDRIGFIYYTPFYFKSRVNQFYRHAIDQPFMYDVYRKYFGGRAKYVDYLKAVDRHYDKVLIEKRRDFIEIARITARKDALILMCGAIGWGILNWSYIWTLYFFAGGLIYFILRACKFLMTDKNRNLVCTNIIVRAAIERHRNEQRALKRKSRRQSQSITA